MSILFNQICINEEMLPKCTYVKLYDPVASQDNSSLEYRRDLVKRHMTLCWLLSIELNLKINATIIL